MSEKNVTNRSSGPQKGKQIYFLLLLVIILIYIFYPGKTENIVSESKPEPEIYLVVLNGCGISDIAQEVSRQLLDKGVYVMDWENTVNTNCIHQKTRIVIRQKSEDQQEKIAFLKRLTGINDFILAHKENALTEFELVLGKDYINYFK